MIVAYDLRFATDAFSGTATHAFCLLHAMLALPGDYRFVLLWHPGFELSRFNLEPLRRHPRVTWLERRIGPVSPMGLVRLGGLLRSLRPSVYFSPFYLRPVRPGCPCVVTLHDVWPLRWRREAGLRRWLLFRSAMHLTRRARLVVTSSEFSRSEIMRLTGLTAERIRVVRPGVPDACSAAAPRRPAGFPNGSFALTVGVNFPYKNLALLAEAWARFAERPPLRLVAAGREDRRFPRLSTLAAARGVQDVTVLGSVGPGELEWLYREATLLLFPSRYEGYGFPMVEAFARGVPVLAADIPTLRESGHGAAHFLPQDDADTWARAVREMAADPAALGRLREAGLRRAAELTYEATAAGVLEVLREATV